MEAKHTATPWESYEIDGSGCVKSYFGINVAMCVRNAGDGGANNSIANAAFIVRACNAHDDLVWIAEVLQKMDASEGLSPAALFHLRDRAIAALSKAGD